MKCYLTNAHKLHCKIKIQNEHKFFYLWFIFINVDGICYHSVVNTYNSDFDGYNLDASTY